ncbi:MAG: chemotaxis protein CheW, partial [Thermoplasmata archaeon]
RLHASKFLLCRASSSICAFPLGHVLETLRPLPIRPVQATPVFVCGLSVIRGAPVPVVDLTALIGKARAGSIGRWVTLRLGERRLALAVEAVLGIRELEVSTLQALPPLLQDADHGLIESIGTLDSELLMLLEAGRLLPEEIWDALAKEGEAPCR